MQLKKARDNVPPTGLLWDSVGATESMVECQKALITPGT